MEGCSKNLFHLSTEYYPFIKKGGLGDFLFSFTDTLNKRDYNNYVCLPATDSQALANCKLNSTIEVDYFGLTLKTDIYECLHNNTTVYFISNDIINSIPFKYSQPYWEHPNLTPLVVFTKAALCFLQSLEIQADVIYTHDWQMGGVHLFPSLKSKLKAKYITVIHNFGHKGKVKQSQIKYLEKESQNIANKVLSEFNSFSLSTLAISYSDRIVTVSPNYLNEILHNRVSHTDNYIIQYFKEKAIGILNGADYLTWSPASDPYLKKHDFENIYDFKAYYRKVILKILDVEDTQQAIFLFNSRICFQKGISLFLTDNEYDFNTKLVKNLASLNALFIFHGNADEASSRHIKVFQEIIRKANIPNILFKLEYTEQFAHQAISGADFLLHPSIYEPCGLSQIYAMKYGTIPIVTSVGGLVDTVMPIDSEFSTGTGFVLKNISPDFLFEKIIEAKKLTANKDKHQEVIKRVTKEDFSWKKTITEHIDVINELLT